MHTKKRGVAGDITLSVVLHARPRPHTLELRTFGAEILSVMLKLKGAGLSESTIETVGNRLKHLAEHSNLDTPSDVKRFIASKPVANCYKHELAKAYNYYAVCRGIEWTRPKYRFERQVPKIPTTEHLSEIVSRASRKYQVIFRLLATSGSMPIELHRLDVHRDIDLDKGTVTIQGSKGHKGRVLKLKANLIADLRIFLSKYDRFPKPETIGRKWRKYRNRTAKELEKPSIRKIRLYDLRHYFGTMLYHKTKDILYTQQQMGHKKIETTLLYTQLVNFNEDEWYSAVAKTIKECQKLVEAGFEYVCTIQGAKIFRKRK